jgi:hypothetical protein
MPRRVLASGFPGTRLSTSGSPGSFYASSSGRVGSSTVSRILQYGQDGARSGCGKTSLSDLDPANAEIKRKQGISSWSEKDSFSLIACLLQGPRQSGWVEARAGGTPPRILGLEDLLGATAGPIGEQAGSVALLEIGPGSPERTRARHHEQRHTAPSAGGERGRSLLGRFCAKTRSGGVVADSDDWISIGIPSRTRNWTEIPLLHRPDVAYAHVMGTSKNRAFPRRIMRSE